MSSIQDGSVEQGQVQLQWPLGLRERIGWQKAVVAVANKNARILWAVLTQGLCFDADHVSLKPCATAAVEPIMAG